MLKSRRPMEYLLVAALAVALIAVYFFHLGEDRTGVVTIEKKQSAEIVRDKPLPLATEETSLSR